MTRYLAGRPRLRIWFEHQQAPEAVTVYRDSDRARCPTTRRSTSGGVLLYGQRLLNKWTQTQVTIAPSSAEAELSATVKGSSGCLGMISLLRDFGVQARGVLLGDASLALGVIRRAGPGRLRHVDTSLLWIQQKAAERTLEFTKALGTQNPSDGQAKHTCWDLIARYAKLRGWTFLEPRVHLVTVLGHWKRTAPGKEDYDGRHHLLPRRRGCPEVLVRGRMGTRM